MQLDRRSCRRLNEITPLLSCGLGAADCYGPSILQQIFYDYPASRLTRRHLRGNLPKEASSPFENPLPPWQLQVGQSVELKSCPSRNSLAALAARKYGLFQP